MSVFLIALLMPDHFNVTRSLEMNAPNNKIFPLVADFSRWNEWSPWYVSEPNAEYAQIGTMGQTGSSFQWSGKIIGKGSMDLLEVHEPDLVRIKMFFKAPRKMELNSEITFKTEATKTIVTWSNDGKLSYPMGRLFGRFTNEMIGNDLEKGLEKIKTAVEKP